MDDWNDFGAMPHARTAATPALPANYGRDDLSASNSSLGTASDSSLALLQSSSSSSSDGVAYSTPPSRDTSRAASAARYTEDAGSFLSLLPSRARATPDRPRDTGSASSMSLMGSEEDAEAAEPASVMMRKLTDKGDSADGSGMELSPPDSPPRKGDLDDVPDDHELNIEGFRFTSIKVPDSLMSDLGGTERQSSVIASSLLRRVDKSYTKLEVISAKQIKSLLGIFNIFVVLAIFYTLLTIILSNTTFDGTNLVPLPQGVLTDELIATNQGAFFVTTAPVAQARSGDLTSDDTQTPAPPVGNPDRSPAVGAFMRDYLAKQGVYLTHDGVVNGPPATIPPSVRMPVALRQDEGALQPPGPVAPETLQRPVPEGLVRVILIPLNFAVAHKHFRNFSHCVTLIFSLTVFAMGVLYGFRIIRQGHRNITHEQVWVLFLLLVTALYFNVFESVIRIVEEINRPNNDRIPKWVFRMDSVLQIIRDICFSGFTYFYLWASLHSYRILDPTKRLGFRNFYVPKLIVLVPYAVFKALAYPILRLQLSEVPMLSGPAAGFFFAGFRVWNYIRAELLYAVATTIVEIALTGVMAYETVQTMRVLERAPYMKYRTKRVGFRFFLYINFTFYTLFFILQFLLLFGRPKGENIVQIVVGVNTVLFDILWYYTVGPAFLVLGYVMVTAYVHLPHTSVGVIRGWFKSSELAPSGSRWSFSSGATTSSQQTSFTGLGSDRYQKPITWANDEETPRSVVDNDEELQQQIVEPITYRKRESKDSLELKANCFTMQTHVIMFNFAWYVYYYGTPKLDNFRPKENPLPFDYKIAAHVTSSSTDTQVLVIDCSDRIIVTFKGTTSMRNLRTSLQMNHERLYAVVRTSVFGEDESGRLKKLFGRNYANGKIHKGFANAYSSVSSKVMEQVRILRERKKRPVFLTGHSLGGALATLCSLDLWVKLDVSRREIFVSTFGSPRVGNAEFAEVYREVVPLHWRIVVDPDMVAKLPNVGYTHVGKKVVLTPHGEMIIDPNALEHRPWSGEAAGFAYHRKASYLLAMRAWCVRNHGMTYTPVFWPFPVRPEDKRRFAGAFEDDADMAAGRRVAAKIVRMDAMVDALGRSDTELSNMAVVEKWGRLTRRILLNDKLTTN